MERKQSKIFLTPVLIFLMGFTGHVSWAQSPCSGYSSLACDQVVVGLPYQPKFNTYDGGLLDKDGQPTGFTMVATASGTAHPNDAPYTSSALPGYEPSRLEVLEEALYTNPGRFKVQASKGKNYLVTSSNNQLNQLGVGIQAQNKRFLIDTEFKDNLTLKNWAQMGLWYGLGQDDYVKLIISKTKIQFVLEVAGVRQSIAEVNLADPPTNYVSTNDLRLVIEVDYTQFQTKLRGYYQVEGQALSLISTFNHDFGTGVNLAGGINNVSFAGIHVTAENRDEFDATYEYFKITELDPAVFGTLNAKSLIPANQWLKTLPYNLEFNGNQGGLSDKNGQGSGFFMVAPPKEYLIADGFPTYGEAGGFEPEDLEIINGQLQANTRNGSSYSTNNGQVNMLGVGVAGNNDIFQIETKFTTGSSGTGNSQAGIWCGWDQDNFMKLVVINQKIEFSIERNGSGAGFFRSAKIDGIHTQSVRFILRVDNVRDKAQAYYQLDGGSLIFLKEFNHDLGTGVSPEPGINNISFAGIAFSDESGAAFTVSYEYFKVSSDYWAKATGNWNASNLWAFSESDPAVDIKPGPGSRVFIKGHQITLHASTTCGDVALIDTNSPTRLIIPQNLTLTVQREVTLQRSQDNTGSPDCKVEIAPNGSLQTQ